MVLELKTKNQRLPQTPRIYDTSTGAAQEQPPVVLLRGRPLAFLVVSPG
jgi:hypothetical protein